MRGGWAGWAPLWARRARRARRAGRVGAAVGRVGAGGWEQADGAARWHVAMLAGVPGPGTAGRLPVAPPPGRSPPSPEATCGPEPGDSCLAKLGAPRGAVKTARWKTMWTIWG